MLYWCVLCANKKFSTREELASHIAVCHEGWKICKGCDNPVTTWFAEDNGWCDDCRVKCYDCLDEEV